jgi:subtilase family serine protease
MVANAISNTPEDGLTPMAAGTAISTYTPAQIRAAYGMPALPAAGVTPTAAQAASMGAGQTIYLIDAQDDPNAAAELAAFNQKFGLPACTTKTGTPTSAAPTAGCEFWTVYSSGSKPSYDSGWASEIALDVQWAHATAPMARIVLIEAPSPSASDLVSAIAKANALGNGVVSMSFGGTETSGFTNSYDSYFSASNMTYVASTGDTGAGVNWPAVSTRVVAVGGTTLSYSGSGTRAESAWTGSGGGISAYTSTPAYQSGISVARRSVADVSFNADPSTGQYLAIIQPGSTVTGWMSAGGTSISAPQWAGILAVSNAQRIQASKTALGDPHQIIYTQIASMDGNYASDFYDVKAGADGSCATCAAKTGYDTPTGLGTPNATSLLSFLLSNTNVIPPVAPTVTAATIHGTVGTALSFTASATGADALSYAISGAPTGMTINASTGVVTWATPVAGTYLVTVTVTDIKTALTGNATYTVNIVKPVPPSVTGATVTGTAGTPLSYTVVETDTNAVTYSMSGAPSGMVINNSGVISWAAPVIGSYQVTVTATDSVNHLAGTGVMTVKINAAPVPPVSGITLTAPAMAGVAGKAMSTTLTIKDPGSTGISLAITGVPAGVQITGNTVGNLTTGMSLLISWASPVTGTYTIKVTATDPAGHSAALSIPITVTAK